MTARALATLLPASLAGYVENVWLGCPDASAVDVVPVTALAAHRDAMLEAMALRYAGDPALHAGPMLSQWSKYYFRLVVPAALGAALVLRQPLAMSAVHSAVGLRDGMPLALYLPEDALGAPDEDPAVRYRSLCDDHLPHMIAAVSAMARLAPRVLWSNAGNLLDSLFEQASLFPDRTGDKTWLFKAGDTFRSGEGNALRCPVRWVTPRAACLGTPFRSRRVCCMRYEIPGEETDLCSSCPRLLTMSDAELAEQASLPLAT
ncbi:MAG: siderophore-iron reductase FhuF [Janthinobacterium lividum]